MRLACNAVVEQIDDVFELERRIYLLESKTRT